MKSEPKAFASLSSGLLARKGSARPAMRPQGFGQGGSLEDLGWNDMGHETPQPTLMPVDGAEFGGHSEPQVSRTPLAGLTPVSPVHHQQAEIEERFGYGDEEGEKAEELAWEAEASAEEPHEDDTLELADELPEAMPVAEPISEPAVPSPVVPLMRAPVEIEPEPSPMPQVVVRPAPKAPRAPRSQRSAKEKAAFTLRLDPNRHLKLRLACAVNAKSAQQLVTKALDELLASMPELDSMASKASDKASRKE